MANPAFQDGVPPAKSNARAYLAFILDNADTLRNTDMGGTWVLYIRDLDLWFERDPTDTTTADDGVSTIVDPTGARWKSTQSVLGGIRIDAAGDTATRDDYDEEPQPFVYYDVEAELAYVKQSNDSGDWSPGFPIRGPTAPPNELSIGTVGVGPAAAQIVGAPPSQTLNLVLPPGPANALVIGLVQEGETADALITGSPPTQTLNLTLPRGPKGDGLQIDAVGALDDRNIYDDEPAGFSFLATDTAEIYFKLSNDTADWSSPVAFGGVGGPNESTPNALARWFGTAGTEVKDSPNAILDDDGNLALGGDGLEADLTFSLNTAAGQTRGHGARSGGLLRWLWGADDVAEGGDELDPDKGSNWFLAAFDDAGEFLANAISIARNTGYATFIRVYEGANRVLSVVGGVTLTGGFAGTSTDHGSISSSTLTLAFAVNNLHQYTNEGSHDLPAPAGEGTMIVTIFNGDSPGMITPTGFDSIDGDSFDDTAGSIFKAYIDVVAAVASIIVKKVA
jgi:hypothetical protein